MRVLDRCVGGHEELGRGAGSWARQAAGWHQWWQLPSLTSVTRQPRRRRRLARTHMPHMRKQTSGHRAFGVQARAGGWAARSWKVAPATPHRQQKAHLGLRPRPRTWRSRNRFCARRFFSCTAAARWSALFLPPAPPGPPSPLLSPLSGAERPPERPPPMPMPASGSAMLENRLAVGGAAA